MVGIHPGIMPRAVDEARGRIHPDAVGRAGCIRVSDRQDDLPQTAPAPDLIHNAAVGLGFEEVCAGRAKPQRASEVSQLLTSSPVIMFGSMPFFSNMPNCFSRVGLRSGEIWISLSTRMI